MLFSISEVHTYFNHQVTLITVRNLWPASGVCLTLWPAALVMGPITCMIGVIRRRALGQVVIRPDSHDAVITSPGDQSPVCSPAAPPPSPPAVNTGVMFVKNDRHKGRLMLAINWQSYKYFIYNLSWSW